MIDARTELEALVREADQSLAALSRMLGRNANYLTQWITRGTPRLLAERDRRRLADYFGVAEERLGGPPARGGWRVPRLDVRAAAGSGAVNDGEALLGVGAVTPELARALGLQEGRAAIIRVAGDSMAPGLLDGDELLVDETRRTPDARGGVYVVRVDGTLLVKRVRRGRGRLIVTSDNPASGPVEGEVDVLGRVVWQMRRPA